MKTINIYRHKQKLDGFLKKIERLPEDDLEMRSDFSRYFCVLISGFLEESVKTMLLKYCEKKAHSHISSYVGGQLRGFQNPKMQKIQDLLRAFNPSWALELEIDSETKDAIDTIVENRNKIAHGKDVSLSFIQVQAYYKKAVGLIEQMEIKILE